MLDYFKKIIKYIIYLYPNSILLKEATNQKADALNERPIEFRFVFVQLSKFYPKTVLDVGTGMTALPHLIRNCGFIVTAIDNIDDYWPSGMINRHYHVINDDITNTKLEKKFDFITCVSVLEHIEYSEDAIQNMCNLLNPNGYLLLSFPYTENMYIPNVYVEEESTCGQEATYITQSFSRQNLTKWCSENNINIIEQEYWRCWVGKFWTAGRTVIPPVPTNKDESHQLTCLLLQKNS